MRRTLSPERQDIVLQLLLQQKEEGMRKLFHYYSGALLSLIKPIVVHNDVAEEVLQDVLMRIWENIESYDSKKSRLFTWMARIARNASIDKTRSREYKELYKTDKLDDSVGRRKELSQTLPTDGIGVASLLNKLDDKHRLLLELLYLQDYTQSEAAKELDIPLGTVKTRARRAILQLRTLLSSEMVWLAFMVFTSHNFQNL